MDREKWKSLLTRRSFLKHTTASAGAIAISEGVISTAEKASAQSPSTARSKKYSWETSPAAIPDSKIKGKVTTDILIIGAGIAGITASLSAVESGVKPIVIEKHRHYNCRGGDNAAIGSKVQKKLGV
jgi:fumarate reductase flavoprotein subunit